MFNKSLAALSIMLCGVGNASAAININMKENFSLNNLQQQPHSYGKQSHKPSGAAALKRASKKRNNIRKHN